MKQKMRDDGLPVVELMRNSVQSFLRAGRMEPDSIIVDANPSLTRSREEYMLSMIDDHYRCHGVVAPASTFNADLLRVEMYNFRGISGKSVFDLDALPPGTVFLVASNNGNGKSTLLEAIFWCLYGKFLDPEVSAEEIVHTGKRSCSVALYFRNGYTFTRSRMGKRPKFEISYCGTLVEQGHDAGTTTQYLESHLLHMTSETFRRTIVITDHANSAFLALRDAQRTKSLDLMFGLDILRELRSRAEQDSKENKKNCIEAQAECDKANDALKTLASLLQECFKEGKKLKFNVECKETVIQDLRQSYDDIQSQLQTKKDSIENLQRSIEAMREEIARSRHQIKLHQTREKVRRLQAEVEQYQVEMAREKDKEHIWVQAYSFAYALGRRYVVRFIRAISSLGAAIPWLNRVLPPAVHISLTRLIPSVLPPATALFQDDLIKSMDELRKSEALLHVLTSMPLTKWNAGHEDEDRPNANSGPLNDHALRSMDKLEWPHISQLVHQAEDFVGLAEQKQTEYHALLEADEKDYSTLNEQTRKMSCNISHQNGQLAEMRRQQDSWSKRADQLTQQHQELIKLRKEKMDERSRVEGKQALSTFWLEQLQDSATQKGPFMTFCRAGYINSFNAVIAKVLDELNRDSEGLATQSLGFQLKADYTLEPTHGALSMGRRSKGQKTRTYLAFFLAMFQQMRSRVPLRTSFVFLDEVMDTLDLHGIEALQRWLQRYVAARGMQAFLMTHRETTLVGNVIEVIRDRKRGTVYKLRQEERQG
jgi:archaellum component FlaC